MKITSTMHQNVFHSRRALGGLVDLEVNVDPTPQVEQKETIY